jgi:hypothetical protein
MPKPPAMPPILTNQQLTKNQERLEKKQDRMEKREIADGKLDVFQTELTRRAKGWSIAARLVGSAYKIADNGYRDTLSKKAASDALEIQIFFSVLTVATSGALGWVSAAAAKASGGLESAFRDAIDSSIQATAGELFSANGPLLFPASGGSTVSADPQVFQNDLQNKVDAMFMDVLQAFIEIRKEYLKLPLEAWDKYDVTKEKANHEECWTKADGIAGKDDLPDVAWMARELERGRWVKYVLDNHSYRDFGAFQTADTPDYLGDDVYNRIADLGVSQADVRPKARGFRVPPSDLGKTTPDRVWDWAKKYTVRKFTDEKKNPKGGGPDHQ